MIKLERTRTQVVINPVFTGVRRIENNKKLIQEHIEIIKKIKEKHQWDSSIWGKSKVQLLIESKNKCAYCEAPLKAVAYGDVEHYRPKSIYWWLAYCYENYLVSCTLCNQAFKKDKFPLADAKKKLNGPVLKENLTDQEIENLAINLNPDPINESEGMPYSEFFEVLKGEYALLVNPYYEEPEMLFEYSVENIKKEVTIVIKQDIENAKKIHKAIVENYGLNRLELSQLRYEWYDLYYTHKLVLTEDTVSKNLKDRAIQKINELKLDHSPFAGMIRYFENLK